ncbi:uncharacterized protein [Nicotiana tomentosiformis]|uniref:uncharacterized protein n=1 Tax=Nicotiana tomentosiformis TaxID=4098 RepID=UPI00388C5B3B
MATVAFSAGSNSSASLIIPTTGPLCKMFVGELIVVIMTGSTSSFAYTPDPTSPLFLLSSDVPGMSPVPVLFLESEFGGWKRNMIVSLSVRNKITFIDGSCRKPVVTSPYYKQCDRCNNMVISWLTSSLSQDIAESVQYSEIAERSFDIASYFTKLKRIWDELVVMCSSDANSYNCVAKEGLQKEKEEDKVHQFLMGLNEVYVGVRSNLLMMQPLPSLDNVYNIIFQDEKQIQVNPPPQFTSKATSFNMNSPNKPTQPQLNVQLQGQQRQFTQRVNFDN